MFKPVLRIKILLFSYLFVFLLSNTSIASANLLHLEEITFCKSNSLRDQLLADPDFKELTLITYRLNEVIGIKENFYAFSKYIKNTISETERDKLLFAFGLNTASDLNNLINNYLRLLDVSQRKFPEIVNSNNLSDVKMAAETILSTNYSKLTLGDCWLALLTWNSACYSYCALQSQYDYYSCVWACIDTGMLLYGACWGAVEL